MHRVMLLALIFFIGIHKTNAQIMHNTVVKPVETVDIKPKLPTVTFPLVKLPEIILAIDSVHRLSPASQWYYFHFTATFKNFTNNLPGYRVMIERYNHPAEVMGQYAFNPSTPNQAKIVLGRDSTVAGSVKLWCETVVPGGITPNKSNKVEY